MYAGNAVLSAAGDKNVKICEFVRPEYTEKYLHTNWGN